MLSAPRTQVLDKLVKPIDNGHRAQAAKITDDKRRSRNSKQYYFWRGTKEPCANVPWCAVLQRL